MHLCKDRTIEHWKSQLNCKMCDYKAFNQLDFDSHIYCEMCQEDFKDIDHLEQHNLFEEHQTAYQQLITNCSTLCMLYMRLKIINKIESTISQTLLISQIILLYFFFTSFFQYSQYSQNIPKYILFRDFFLWKLYILFGESSEAAQLSSCRELKKVKQKIIIYLYLPPIYNPILGLY